MTEQTKAKRQPRETQTRENTARRKPWAPPSMLEAPPAPEGFVHRWIRTGIRGEDDKTNVHARLREGWEPVREPVALIARATPCSFKIAIVDSWGF